MVDLQPVRSLFGHRSPVTVLAVSRSFSALLSASMDGQIVLWDLNQHSFVRELPVGGTVEVSLLGNWFTYGDFCFDFPLTLCIVCSDQ